MVRQSVLLLVLSAAVVSPVSRAADHPLVVTFQEAKTAYNARRYDDADVSLRRLAELLAAPEYQALRGQVLPSYYFYSSAVAFERKDEQRARESLRQFLALQPNVKLDEARYPKSYVKFFEVERKKFEKEGVPPEPAADQIAPELADFVSFHLDAAAIPTYTGEPEWADSPVRALLEDADRKTFRALSDEDDRRQFVEGFWRRLDPNPLTRENEFQGEFYRRVQYADRHFSTEGEKGALSDRGRVFLILGPPTYTSSGVVVDNEDGRAVVTGGRAGPMGPTLGISSVPMTITRTTMSEIWRYRGQRIPKGIPAGELVFTFYTRQGYGTAVLQKDSYYAWLQTASRLLRNPGSAD